MQAGIVFDSSLHANTLIIIKIFVSLLLQFGLIDIPDINDDDEPLDLSDDDFDLEAELAAISGGGGQKPKPRKPPPKPAANLDAMIAESLKDVPSDDEGSGESIIIIININSFFFNVGTTKNFSCAVGAFTDI